MKTLEHLVSKLNREGKIQPQVVTSFKSSTCAVFKELSVRLQCEP